MSANVEQFVVHQIILNEQGKLEYHPRSSCFDISEPIVDLASQLHHNFNAKPSKGVGGFSQELDQTIHNLLVQMRSQEITFYDFSVSASEKLLQSILDEAMLETGYVVFSQYEYLATEYLMVAMLNTKESVTVSQALELSQNKFLDLPKMQIAVQINLTQFEINEQDFRYISFIKGRMGRKVSDFFMNFIGCDEKVDTKEQNKQFVHHLDNYLSEQGLDAGEKHQHREAVSSYYKDKANLGENIEIKELDKVLPRSPEGDYSFSAYNASLDAPLEPAFQADKSMLNAMNKFAGAGGGVSLSFDRKLLGERVFYDIHSDTITIKGLPPNLRDQLSKSAKSGGHQ